MQKVPSILTLGAAVIASAAIAIGFYFNHNEDFETVQEPAAQDEVVLASRTDMNSDETASELGRTSFGEAGPEAGSSNPLIGPAREDSSVLLQVTGGEEPSGTSPIDPLETNLDALRTARSAFVQHDYETCASHLQPIADAGDARFDVHYLLGLSLRYLGQFEEAEAAMADALEVAPQNVRALVNSARNLVEMQRFDEARARVQKAIDIDPTDGDAWNVLGRVELGENRLQAAVEAFSHATEVDDSNAYALNNLGFTFLQLGEWQQAAEALETAILLKSDVAYFHNNLGVSYERIGELGKAVQAYAEAVRLQPEHSKAQISLARVTPLLEQQTEMAAGDAPAQPDGIEVDDAAEDSKTVAVKPE